jgi:hypothetical protein
MMGAMGKSRCIVLSKSIAIPLRLPTIARCASR